MRRVRTLLRAPYCGHMANSRVRLPDSKFRSPHDIQRRNPENRRILQRSLNTRPEEPTAPGRARAIEDALGDGRAMTRARERRREERGRREPSVERERATSSRGIVRSTKPVLPRGRESLALSPYRSLCRAL